jgi:hypothetical protein
MAGLKLRHPFALTTKALKKASGLPDMFKNFLTLRQKTTQGYHKLLFLEFIKLGYPEHLSVQSQSSIADLSIWEPPDFIADHTRQTLFAFWVNKNLITIMLVSRYTEMFTFIYKYMQHWYVHSQPQIEVIRLIR